MGMGAAAVVVIVVVVALSLPVTIGAEIKDAPSKGVSWMLPF
jgi:hypothetical protein